MHGATTRDARPRPTAHEHFIGCPRRFSHGRRCACPTKGVSLSIHPAPCRLSGRLPTQRPLTPKLREKLQTGEEKSSSRKLLCLVWSDSSTTCLSVRLDPNEATHRAVTCKGCIVFFEKKLKSNINNYNPNLTRSRCHLCERPFHCRDGAMPYKLHTQERLKQLFAASGTVSVPRKTGLVVSPPPPIRWPKS